tara:strand:+ start:11709 stop:12377 length:669 start_codon:yes stop_codon:yes gene_type:complete
MNCRLCNNKETYFSSTYNCSICKECGYIHIGKIFDNVAPFIPKKIRDKQHLIPKDRVTICLNMLSAQFDIKEKIIKQCYVKYDSCIIHGLLHGYTDDEIAVSILYIIMHENNQKVIIRNYCKFMDINVNRCLTLSKKINKVVIITDHEKYLESFDEFNKDEIKQIALKLEIIESRGIAATRNVIAAETYNSLSGRMTQYDISKMFGISRSALNKMIKKIYEV